MRNSCGRTLLFSVFFIFISSAGYSLSPTEPIEALYRLENLPLLRPGIECKMFSSYDRAGGNDDGFAGTYSKLRVEDGNSVIAEMEGAGCIQRIWFTHSMINQDGLLNRKGEHLKIFLDGSEQPTIDVPLEQIFSGELEPFPKPLVGSILGGFYCYVPIPYQNGCKVVVEGTGVRFYHLTYLEYPDSTKVTSFSMHKTPGQKQALAEAVSLWSSLGELKALQIPGASYLQFDLNLKDQETAALDLPKGKYLIRAILLNVDDENRENALTSQFAMTWDRARKPAVEAPFRFFFGQAFSPESYRSLFVGSNDEGYYNFFPMPYTRSSTMKITASKSFKGILKVVLQPLPFSAKEVGYFHANYFEQVPTEDGLHYIFLNTEGEGHYVGTYLATEGPKGEPGWLEGDEKFIIDGDLAIHGTGSEDYFNCGWYAVSNRLNQAGVLPEHGFPVYGLTEDSMQAVAYRWHLTDPVPYQKSIDAKIEHGPTNNRRADYRSIVYFYDTRPSKVGKTQIIPIGDECIHYLDYRIWQLALEDPEQGLSLIKKLSKASKRKINKELLKGLRYYVEGMIHPSKKLLGKLENQYNKIEELIQASTEQSPDQKVPQSWLTTKEILKRARYHLSRHLAEQTSFEPGDELLIEVRDPWGDLTPAPSYLESEDFQNSYAKSDNIYLMGNGARFTYGTDAQSWARFTPDIPETGYYEIKVIFSYGSNASDTRYLIRYAEGETTKALQQRGRIGTSERNLLIWHNLGTYKFEKGQDPLRGSVTLLAGPEHPVPNSDYEYRAYADAIVFVYKGKRYSP